MACRKKVVIGVLLAGSLGLAGCEQRPAAEAVPVDAAATTSAAPAPAPVAAADPTRSASPAATASSRIFIDPVTGEQRAPTPAEAAAARSDEARPVGSAAARQKAPVEEVPVPGGFTEVRIGEGAMREEKVCLQPDGSLAACGDQH